MFEAYFTSSPVACLGLHVAAYIVSAETRSSDDDAFSTVERLVPLPWVLTAGAKYSDKPPSGPNISVPVPCTLKLGTNGNPGRISSSGDVPRLGFCSGTVEGAFFCSRPDSAGAVTGAFCSFGFGVVGETAGAFLGATAGAADGLAGAGFTAAPGFAVSGCPAPDSLDTPPKNASTSAQTEEAPFHKSDKPVPTSVPTASPPHRALNPFSIRVPKLSPPLLQLNMDVTLSHNFPANCPQLCPPVDTVRPSCVSCVGFPLKPSMNFPTDAVTKLSNAPLRIARFRCLISLPDPDASFFFEYSCPK